jgi:hypothetical protein
MKRGACKSSALFSVNATKRGWPDVIYSGEVSPEIL